jgi:hypothetical protein
MDDLIMASAVRWASEPDRKMCPCMLLAAHLVCGQSVSASTGSS